MIAGDIVTTSWRKPMIGILDTYESRDGFAGWIIIWADKSTEWCREDALEVFQDGIEPAPEPLREDRCENCRWWLRKAKLSECHRGHPVPITTEDGMHFARWPITAPHDWCGDFEKRAAL